MVLLWRSQLMIVFKLHSSFFCILTFIFITVLLHQIAWSRAKYLIWPILSIFSWVFISYTSRLLIWIRLHCCTSEIYEFNFCQSICDLDYVFEVRCSFCCFEPPLHDFLQFLFLLVGFTCLSAIMRIFVVACPLFLAMQFKGYFVQYNSFASVLTHKIEVLPQSSSFFCQPSFLFFCEAIFGMALGLRYAPLGRETLRLYTSIRFLVKVALTRNFPVLG